MSEYAIPCRSRGFVFGFHDLILTRKPSDGSLIAKCIAHGCLYSCLPSVQLAEALAAMQRIDTEAYPS